MWPSPLPSPPTAWPLHKARPRPLWRPRPPSWHPHPPLPRPLRRRWAPAALASPEGRAPDVSEGRIAHYARKFAGRRTASGERFNPAALTLAHNSLPFGTKVRITNLANKRSVVARVNDRGPSTPGRIADLSTAAARRIGMLRAGIVEAKLEVVSMPTAKAVRAKRA